MENNRPVVGVFCGSSQGSDAAFARDARRFGALIGARGFSMVFGGGYIGLMGEVARAARAGGAHVTGVLPEFLHHLEPPAADEERVILTADLQERKRLMLATADAFAILPGGLGTLDEFFEVLTSLQLKVFDKPLVLLDTAGFFADLERLLAGVRAKAFADDGMSSLYRRATTPEEAIGYLAMRLGHPPRP